MASQPKPQQVQVKVTDDVLKGFYANMCRVLHTKEEFIMDFASVAGQQGIVGSRVITSPAHFKRLLAALNDNLRKYESQFGTISEGTAPAEESQMGFTVK